MEKHGFYPKYNCLKILTEGFKLWSNLKIAFMFSKMYHSVWIFVIHRIHGRISLKFYKAYWWCKGKIIVLEYSDIVDLPVYIPLNCRLDE